MAAAFRKGEPVLVSYGSTRVLSAPAQFAVSGRAVDRRHYQRGWYEVALRWDMEAQREVTVMAHGSALTSLMMPTTSETGNA